VGEWLRMVQTGCLSVSRAQAFKEERCALASGLHFSVAVVRKQVPSRVFPVIARAATVRSFAR